MYFYRLKPTETQITSSTVTICSRMTCGNGECVLLIIYIKSTLASTDQMMAGPDV